MIDAAVMGCGVFSKYDATMVEMFRYMRYLEKLVIVTSQSSYCNCPSFVSQLYVFFSHQYVINCPLIAISSGCWVCKLVKTEGKPCSDGKKPYR